MFELLTCLLPTTNSEIHAKLSSVHVESKNGYDLIWCVLEITVPAFDPTVPLQQSRWDPDVDILEFSRRHKLYFRLQAKKQIYFTTHDHTTMFLKAVASSEYADIITTFQSNVDSFRDPDDEFFLPQNYRVTNIAMLIHNHTKAHVRDLGQRCIDRVAGWDSMCDNINDDELQFCHIQGYLPRVLHIEQGHDRGPGGRGPDRRGFDRRQGFDPRQARPTSSGDQGPALPRGRFAIPNRRRRAFLPDKQCDACKRIGHEAINCDMLALALFIECYKQSIMDSERN
jgi:hypothetical protein